MLGESHSQDLLCRVATSAARLSGSASPWRRRGLVLGARRCRDVDGVESGRHSAARGSPWLPLGGCGGPLRGVLSIASALGSARALRGVLSIASAAPPGASTRFCAGLAAVALVQRLLRVPPSGSAAGFGQQQRRALQRPRPPKRPCASGVRVRGLPARCVGLRSPVCCSHRRP